MLKSSMSRGEDGRQWVSENSTKVDGERVLTDTDKGQGIGSRSGSDDLTDTHDDDEVVVGG